MTTVFGAAKILPRSPIPPELLLEPLPELPLPDWEVIAWN